MLKKYLSLLITFLLLMGIWIPASADPEASYSSVKLGYTTPVKNQGVSGCCWAFAVISCLESDAIIKGYETKPDFSEAHLAWKMLNGKTDNIYYYAADTLDAAVALSVYPGLTDESEYPFYPYNLSKMGNYDEKSYYYNNGYTLSDVCFVGKDGDTVKKIHQRTRKRDVRIYYTGRIALY